ILGPRKSPRIPTKTPISCATPRIRSTKGLACSAERWEKFSRATSIPASINRRNISSPSLAGPIVATIFVRLVDRAIQRIVTEPLPNHKSEEGTEGTDWGFWLGQRGKWWIGIAQERSAWQRAPRGNFTPLADSDSEHGSQLDYHLSLFQTLVDFCLCTGV